VTDEMQNSQSKRYYSRQTPIALVCRLPDLRHIGRHQVTNPE